jgi:hypothetical protein
MLVNSTWAHKVDHQMSALDTFRRSEFYSTQVQQILGSDPYKHRKQIQVKH